MPPALDRLLASPSALRVLRSIVKAPELPVACQPAVKCCRSTRRNYSQKPVRPESQECNSSTRAPHALDSIEFGEVPFQAVNNAGEDLGDDPTAWAQELSLRSRIHSDLGIKEVWARIRRYEHELPTTDTPNAEYLWATIISCLDLVIPAIDHAAELLKDNGQTYPRLYELVMGYWLPRRPRKALGFHHRMLIKLRLRKLPLIHLARLGAARFHSQSYKAFMDIYRVSNETGLYDEVVPVLCGLKKYALARRWHNLCVHRGDLPSSTVASHPVIQTFMAETSTISNPRIQFEAPGGAKHLHTPKPRYNEELMRRLHGQDAAPVRFDDSFCARIFATKSFQSSSIIKGLAMVGVNEIGPLAVLNMAVNTPDINELPLRFQELRAAGIALQGCVFSLALEKFAMEKRWALVHSIRDSDLHPDVFGDVELQKKLLSHYLDRSDFSQAYRTLAILTLFHNNPSPDAWNTLLQARIRRYDPHAIFNVLRDMRSHGVMVTPESTALIKGMLRHRRKRRNPITIRDPQCRSVARFDDLRFVTRAYMSILESGLGILPPNVWREIIRRYGMLNRMKELRRVLYWLLCWYAPRSEAQFSTLPKPSFLDATTEKIRAMYPDRRHYFHFPAFAPGPRQEFFHPIRQLFPPSLQQALITWGFRASLMPNAPSEQSIFSAPASKRHFRERFRRKGILQRVHWSIGLRTVVQLRDLGVQVEAKTVAKALRMQFINLFGRGHSRKPENRAMELANTTSYHQYVKEVNDIWGSELFVEPWKLKECPGAWHPRYPRLRYWERRAALIVDDVPSGSLDSANGVEEVGKSGVCLQGAPRRKCE